MTADLADVNARIKQAVADGQLIESSAKNIRTLLEGAGSDVYFQSVKELVHAAEWQELNDRFYQTLAFGTGGLRGRTIGKVVTTAERGNARESERPEFPCVGTNAMNFFNITRATRGLVAYLQDCNRRDERSTKPKIVIAHDPRFFSKEFAELAAKVAAENGCDAFVFDGPRSVPELSFAVRYLHACAGIVITASHNPPHDNGYKVYFDDGAQVIEPHASGIIAKVNAITQLEYGGSTALTTAASVGQVGSVKALLELGADPRLKMKDGGTALSHAQESKNEEVVALIQAALAKAPPPAKAPPARKRSGG